MSNKEKPTYYAILTADVRYSDKLKANEKLLYAEITALTQKDGTCWATNKYFSELYNVSTVSISKWVNNLVKQGFIKSKIKYKKGSKEIEGRYLTLVKGGIKQKLKGGIKQKFKDNNTSINNIKRIESRSFIKPTIDEIAAYCSERKNNIDAESFFHFYEGKNWFIGKNKMVSWKSAIITWEKRDKNNNNENEGIKFI